MLDVPKLVDKVFLDLYPFETNDINDLFRKLGIGNFGEFQVFERPKANYSSHLNSDMNVGSPKIVGSFLRPQNNSNLKNNLVMNDNKAAKAAAKSFQSFMRLLEENPGIKRTIRNFDTSEEIPIRGSPRRLELVVRPRFMKKEGIGMTKTANAMSGNATKVDKRLSQT